MSFSKAKLKRFNETGVTNSPYSDRIDRKESIKKWMKELSKDAEIKRTQPTKESAAPSDSEKAEKQKSTAEKTKHSALRLFRTLFEVNEKMSNVERFAKTTVEKCAEISNKSGSSKRCKQIDQLKESNTQLKDKISQLQMVNKEQETKINELKEHSVNVTPRKLNISHSNLGTPKMPKTPKSFCGKENQSPAVVSVGFLSPNPSAFRARNNKVL